ncbi:monovalent cation:proton antiporter-2 (CPA2) family protein [Chelatococcus reniformis]|uniref:Potassium efflux system protein n=1 Tax=Chelatococcus reniformis TaxID=1494448 RepID=A0A916XPG2_9HYPH|nr:monovalent cation:proton antiporter-2 (CPA2) family protein [Chelatococcus reniformis]GGC88393.1 potassium efflux system protein [Chelatococcus reniformis]
MAESSNFELVQIVAVLGAGVVAAPLFKRAGLGSVLGYLAAGLAIGPFGLEVIAAPEAVLHFAELGVVMFLFVIGLEMRPARLWSLRKDIFGLGAAQVAACGALLTGLGVLAGLDPAAAFIAAMGFVLSSTAAIIQILDETGETATPAGQRAVSILLLEDLAIVPLLAVVALLAPATGENLRADWMSLAMAVGAVAVVVAAGRWLLNPLFALLSAARAREIMTAAALTVVLGTALLMQVSGLSMAMGAFLAGVLLSGSTFRHQLEADIEPFRGLLLGLFFMAVGMSLNLAVVLQQWPVVALAVVGYMLVKAVGIAVVALLFGAGRREAIYRAALFAQGGEFAFVLYGAAAAVGLFDPLVNAIMSSTVIISMVLTPLAVVAARRLLPAEKPDLDGLERPDGLHGSVLLVGFGRFGQVVSQAFLARGLDVTIIDNDPDMIRSAAKFGFKIYYGDGTNLDVLHASGAAHARVLAVCIDNREAANKIVALAKEAFPNAGLLVRAYDRGHALELMNQKVDFQMRETLESALAFGRDALEFLGLPSLEAAETIADIRRLDAERFSLDQTSGLYAGAALLHSNAPKPEPFVRPRQTARALNPEAGALAEEEAAG